MIFSVPDLFDGFNSQLERDGQLEVVFILISSKERGKRIVSIFDLLILFDHTYTYLESFYDL
jgi:hypothetical protein